jgi:hypothetical protein
MFGRVLRWVGLTTQVPIIGTAYRKHAEHRPGCARTQADLFAREFAAWLRRRHPAATWLSEDLADVGRWTFSDETGLVAPPMRSLMSALKRSGLILHRQDVRLIDDDGRSWGKRTIWGFDALPGRITVGQLASPWTDSTGSH